MVKQAYLSLTLLLFIITVIPAYNEDSSNVFYSNVEILLQQDYWQCTGDSSRLSSADLIKWKTEIDSITDSDIYRVFVKKFADETGLDPSGVRPCEIIAWKKARDDQMHEHELIYEENEKIYSQRKADSLYIVNELKGKVKRPFDFKTIPFGVSKKCVELLGQQKKLHFVSYDEYLQIDSLILNGQLIQAALFFDQDQRYCRYELESVSGPLDSLDWWIRPRADSLGLYFQKQIGTAPDHSYRTGRFEIVQGRLAITDLWNFSDASVYVGLATYKYRYYGKAVVICHRY